MLQCQHIGLQPTPLHLSPTLHRFINTILLPVADDKFRLPVIDRNLQGREFLVKTEKCIDVRNATKNVVFSALALLLGKQAEVLQEGFYENLKCTWHGTL